jgi:TRAP-type uncharacterized transport system substrate-binding protein
MKMPINRDRLILLSLIAGLTLISISAVVILRHRILRQHLIILAGPEGNPYYKLSQRYQKFLAGKGIEIAVCATAGSPQILDILAGRRPKNPEDMKCTTLAKEKDKSGEYKINPETTFQQLRERGYEVAAGFTQGGVQTLRVDADRNKEINEAKNAAQQLYSMGRVFTEPLWVHYSCDGEPNLNSLGGLGRRTLYIGAKESGTNPLAKFLLGKFAIDNNIATIAESTVDLFKNELPTAASFDVVAAKLLDADQKLSPRQNVCLLNIADADAVAQRFPFLKRVTLHKGALNLGKELPKTDINLVATEAAFLIKRDRDTALQNIFAQAVLHTQAHLGDAAAYFPLASSTLAADDPEFVVSPEALRVYRFEKTFFQGILPFWIATYLDDIIVFLLAIPFFGFLLQVAPVMRDMFVRMRRNRVHREMNALERRIDTAASESELIKIEEERAQIMKKVRDMALPEAERFELRRDNRHVKEHLKDRLQEMRQRM